MAYVTPLTAVANASLTAAQWNSSVRDNLNETAPAKVTGANQIIVGTGAGSIAARAPSTHTVASNDTTTSSTYGDLTGGGAIFGPSLTMTTGSKAFIFISAMLRHGTSGAAAHATFTVSGASTIAASDAYGIYYIASAVNASHRTTGVSYQSLVAGSNTFTMKYRSGTGGVAALFGDRELTVMSL